MEQSSSEFVCRMHLSKYLGSNPEVTIPEGVEVIDPRAFQGKELIKTVTFPASVKTTGWSAFMECKNLETADLSRCENIWSLNNNLFQGCESLTRVILPKQLKYQVTIHGQCFLGCSSLQTLILPAGIVKIDRSAFEDCTSLTHIELPDGISEVDQCVFHGCSSLESIDLPDSLQRGARIVLLCRSKVLP